ncbi:ribonuclease HII [Methylobacillus gramineus]|uniref:ribonuclease HII n=1 Tax=Methylobacillus gramineus TaxID=755169 RepID=UPI001CFFD44A|nr:ribonuclease HII [Methylobacillus gramineus]MCB5184361.1 ribonuclease HII [Methylobacillus gramineus]
MSTTLIICGVDEAGRGPLAGAVYAAAVILNPSKPILGLADSKVISEKKREHLAIQIKENALAWAIASCSAVEIDEINILQASLLAMKRAIEQLSIVPGQVLVDGLHCPNISIPAQGIVKGDSKVKEISAASILAKTARDHEMYQMHAMYPQYDFAKHKGYPTAQHLKLLAEHGASEIHRRSYAPVRRVLGL